jgi:hypothetical protein
VVAWEAKQWSYLADCARHGPAARRKHNGPLIIPVSSFDPRACHEGRATIWDLRGHAPGALLKPMDFDQPIRTKFDTAFLARALGEYPDRELVTFLVCGVALKTESAPPDLVLCPHLVSLCRGVSDAAKTVNVHAARGAYGLFSRGPAIPRRALAQGLTPKTDLTDRRTTDGGGPRKKTQGVKSLNEASKEAAWVPEVKPKLDGLSNDMAVLLHAGGVLGLKLYQFTDDFKWFFNQLALHPSQWHLITFMWLTSLEEDAVLAHVMEYVLGFGLSPSSNVAQRFAEGILWLLRRRVHKDEAALRAADKDPAHQAYDAERAALGPGRDRLITARCYTDDSHFFALGVERSLSVLRHWGDITASIRVEMASFEKRQAGGVVEWLGVLTCFVLGTFVVSHAKTLKALLTLRALLGTPSTVRFRDHRKLAGLLEHIVGVIHARRLVMYSLYEPHRRLHGEPEGVVELTALGRLQVAAWISAMLATPGRHCAASLAPLGQAAAPHSDESLLRRFLAYTDAAKDGAITPCLGGCCHGFFFSVPIPVLLNDGAHNEQMQWLHLEFEKANGRLATVDQVRHAHGEINVPADFASRDRLLELHELATQLGVTPTRLEVPAGFLDVLHRFEAEFASQPALDDRSAADRARDSQFGEGRPSDCLDDGPPRLLLACEPKTTPITTPPMPRPLLASVPMLPTPSPPPRPLPPPCAQPARFFGDTSATPAATPVPSELPASSDATPVSFAKTYNSSADTTPVSSERTEATDAFATSASSATTPVPRDLSDTSDATPVSSECDKI